MIRLVSKGDYSKATKYLERVREASEIKIAEKYGRLGVAALASASPVDSGLTAS